MQQLSVRSCISFGWRTFTARPSLFIAAGFILLAATLVINGIDAVITYLADSGFGKNSGTAVFIALLSGIAVTGLSFLLDMGRTSFILKAHDAITEVSLKDLWRTAPYWRFVGTSLLFGIALVLGFILLIIPGILVGLIFGFALYRVIDAGSTPSDAFRESAALTKGNRWNLLLLGLALLGINILGFFALIIGLLVTLPVSGLALVHAYRSLEEMHLPVAE